MKTLEPIPREAWDEIKEAAIDVLKSALSARKVIELEGPKGMDHPAVSLGRLDIVEGKQKGVRHGIHRILPMIELRSPFTLDIEEVETIARGARDADLDPVEQAAANLAKSEDTIIYQGYKKAGIPGIVSSTENEKIKWPDQLQDIPAAIIRGILTLQNQHIDGPYSLILDSDKWARIHTMTGNYPLKKQIEEVIDGQICLNKNTGDSMIITERADDFSMTLGKDISLGYDYQDQEKLHLFLMESFTFFVAEPRACIVFS